MILKYCLWAILLLVICSAITASIDVALGINLTFVKGTIHKTMYMAQGAVVLLGPLILCSMSVTRRRSKIKVEHHRPKDDDWSVNEGYPTADGGWK